MTKLTRKKFTKTNLVNIKHHIGKRPKKYFATKKFYKNWSISRKIPTDSCTWLNVNYEV